MANKATQEEAAVVQETTAIVEKEVNAVSTEVMRPHGFEDEEAGDLIIPRIKVIQTLSPERKEKIAEEGDILNSLTQEKLNDLVFVPVFKYNNNIWWIPRNEGGGIRCQARDGKNGMTSGGEHLLCAACRKNEFDNTKTGREAIPLCTKYMNFFGFIEGTNIPIVLSFGKTNYNEGKKLYSLAKVTMQNMWNHGYRLVSKLVKKDGNEWFIIDIVAAGATSAEDRAQAAAMFQSFRNRELVVDDKDQAASDSVSAPIDTNGTEF